MFIWDKKWLDINRWRCPFYNNGRYAFDETTTDGAGRWPYPLDNTYIFGAGLWVGAISGNDTLVTVGYNPNTARSEFFPTPVRYWREGTGNPLDRIYKYPNDWPPPQTRFGYDTTLVPQRNISLQDMWCVYCDSSPVYHDTPFGRPLGIEVYQTIYAWDYPTLEDVFFIKYRIKNVSGQTLRQMYLGICADPDIGMYNDDMVGIIRKRCIGSDTIRDVAFAGDYDNTESNNPPYWESGTPGVVAYKFLDGPRRPDGTVIGMTAFKKFTIDYDPTTNRNQYLTLAGYDYRTLIYSPYDSIDLSPGDKRFLMCTGPFNLLRDSVATIIIAVIGAPYGDNGELWYNRDTNDLKPLCRIANNVQRFYNSRYLTHQTRVIHPNGGEYLSGFAQITYQATSSTTNPLLIDLLYSSDWGISWDTLATGLSNTGVYNWQTLNHPDGVCYLLRVMAYDTITSGSDVSDSLFAINNPGNAPPYIKILSPSSQYGLPESLSGICSIRWFARDPEFRDSLRIDILLRKSQDTIYKPLALNEANDRLYVWDSKRTANGDYWLKLKTFDEQFVTYDSVYVKVRNRISGGNIIHYHGICNLLNIRVWIHYPESLTGHQYEISFREPKPPAGTGIVRYGYDVIDLSTQDTVLKQYYFSAYPTYDFSPIVKGFSIETRSAISSPNFKFDSVKVMSGNYPQDFLSVVSLPSSYQWPFRGSRYKLYWTNYPGSYRTLQVYDIDYGIYIPFRRFQPQPNWIDSAYGWCFLNNNFRSPSDTLRLGIDRYIYICGGIIRLNPSEPITILPDSGSQWIVYPCTLRTPVNGNKYRFQPTYGIQENLFSTTKIQLLSSYPNPFSNRIMINYFIPYTTFATISVYDVTGRKIHTLHQGSTKPGWHTLSWNGVNNNGKKITTGIYFVKLTALGQSLCKKITFIR
ncbi:MAG: T9SS type A sorting domain-containing protein [candidate division WOR-3 bacterium]|nr:T9SS type A sorting domain-containing protein [candidate division WOR-3 bacterium]